MLCKIARTCVGFVARVERSARQQCIKNKKCIIQPLSDYPNILEDKRDHLIRTEGSFRQDEEMECTVIDIEKLSNSVRGIKLLSNGDKALSFKAGQWVDMIIPEVKTVGGFSICSPPCLFHDSGQLLLAVKYSDHPPAKWIHKQCHIGSRVTLKFGGDFCYEPKSQNSRNILLIAGGVGINPIYSILQERCKPSEVGISSATTRLLYSAKSEEDLIFKNEIATICTRAHASCRFFTTRQVNNAEDSTSNSHGRINLKDLKDTIDSFNEEPISFICGPPNFIDSMVESLIVLGLKANDIKYEKWW